MEINNSFAFDSEQEAIRELKRQAEILKDVCVKVWRQYLASYQPKIYVRTGKSERSIKIGGIKKIDENTIGIEVTFQDDLVYHDSIFGGKQGHAIMLISAGWHSKKLEARIGKVYRLTYYEGFDYLGKVREEYEARKHRGIELEIQWSGNFTKK